MKILSITAGAAGMYCGSCFRDNTLAAELIARGHDVVLAPVYTPTRTDENNVSRTKILFGGISIYLQQFWPLFRRTPWFLDKLWDSSWALKLAAQRSIPTDPHLLGELTLSMLKGEEGLLRKEFEKLTAWLAHEPAPDVVNLPNSLLIGMARPIRRALERPVCCTLQGEDLFLEGLEEPYRGVAIRMIRERIADVDLFLAVSDYYAAHMSDYLKISRDQIRTVPLGIHLDGYAAAPRTPSGGFRIGYFARIAPEKGLHVLCEAYQRLRETTDCSLEVAGYLAREHRGYLGGLQQRAQFRYHGALDRGEKIRFLESLDVLSVPSEYAEPKGLYLLEAMAAGVPVVVPRRGAFPEIVERTGGGILVEPGDPDSLACGLLTARADAALSQRAYDGVRAHYSAARMADLALEAYGSLRCGAASQAAGSRLVSTPGAGTSAGSAG